MSINFSTLTGLTIPEGVVTQITDASGRVIWSAMKMANLTITSVWDGMDGDTARITINSPSPFAPDPSNPSNKVTSWTAYVYDLFDLYELYDKQNLAIKIPIGSTIECYITRDKGNAESHIKLNGENVATGEGTYIYTVTGDATIDVSEEYVQGDYGVISIVGAVTYISFTINGETYQTIKGMSWSAWFASSYNTTGETEGTITDASGNEVSFDAVIVGGTVYEVSFDKPVILEVEKITSNTYASSTTYTDESFILLSITPKTANSTVRVTYGGLTKTISFTSTYAKNVFFGTFNGTTDSITTPSSGTLTIEGGYSAVGVGTYNKSKSSTSYCDCITNVTSLGQVTSIPDYAFYNCSNITSINIPESVTSIGTTAFRGCYQIKTFTIPFAVTYIGVDAFKNSLGGSDTYILQPTIPPTLGGDIFGGIGYVTSIVVPAGCGEAYKAAEGWSTYASKIVEVS